MFNGILMLLTFTTVGFSQVYQKKFQSTLEVKMLRHKPRILENIICEFKSQRIYFKASQSHSIFAVFWMPLLESLSLFHVQSI